MNNNDFPTTFTTTDQNTGRTVTWNVEHVSAGRNGFTHTVMATRPAGRSTFVMHVEMNGSEMVRHTNPAKAF